MKKSIFATLSLMAMLAIPAVLIGARYERAATKPKVVQKAMTFSVDLPMEMEMTKEEFGYFTLIDANADNQKWRYQASGMTSPCNDKMASDDWAITPGLRFEDVSSNYEMAFTMQQNMQGDQFISSFEFYIGTAPTVEAMTTLIGKIENFYAPVKDTPYPQAIQFAVPGDPGTYYIGFRCVSPMQVGKVSPWPATFKNLSIKAIKSSAAAPMQPSDITVTPGENGALSATVAFTMPTTSMNGTPLPEGTELNAIIASESELKSVKALPGAAVSQVIATKQGDNEISITVNGALPGEAIVKTVYTGVVLPMRIHDLAAVLSPDNMSMTLTWTPPTEGKDGGYVDYKKLDYVIFLNDGPDGEYRQYTTVGASCTYTYTMQPGEKLRTVKLKVLPRNAAGISTDDISWVDQDPVYVSDMLGTPYALPAIERFDDQDMKYTPLTILRPEGYSGRWMISDPSGCVPDENGSALMAYNPFSEGETMGRVAFPKFSTKGLSNVAFTLKAMRYSSYASMMDVYVRSYTTDLTKLGSINCSSATDWVDVSYPLPAEFQGQEWVQFVIDVYLDDVDYVYAIDSYQVAVSAATDVAVLDITAAGALQVGEPAKFVARVANLGFNAVTPTVRFTATLPDGTEVANETVSVATLGIGDEKNVSWSFTPLAEHIDKELTVKAELLSADEVPSNDVFAAQFHVRLPELPVVTTLSAQSVGEGVQLTWDEPKLNKTLTESFEQLEDFYYGTELGAFTGYDGDGKTVYKFQNEVMPNEQLPKAFLVVNDMRVGEGLEANDGHKYLLATCPERVREEDPVVPANDWLISPELVPGSYVSFSYNIINEKYPETIRVLYSTTTNAPEAFTEIETRLKTRFGWEFLEYRLPADAKYFAINYVSADMFGIMIDAVKYTSAADLHNVTGYNVYRDGVILGRATDRSFIDKTAVKGTSYTYHVTTVTDVESAKGNTVTIVAGDASIDASVADSATAVAIAGGIRIAGANSASIYSVAGVQLYNAELGGATVEVALAPGVYAVTIDGKTMKLPVR